MGTVVWCLGAALGVLRSNKASIPIRTFYAKKYSISPKRGLYESKEFQKQSGHKPFALSTSTQDRYDDDECILGDSTPSEDESDFTIARDTRVTIFNKTEAPLKETNFQVILEILGKGSGKGRTGVDLVTVLDVGSFPQGNAAREDRIAKLKIAMQFVINKLSPIDRLSVVSFDGSSTWLCPLRKITEKSQTEITDIINMVDHGSAKKGTGSDIVGGLRDGLKVLNDRRFTSGRVPAIMLMSGSDLNDCELPDMEKVPVHTVRVGQGYNHNVLRAIACKSKGGTFSDIEKDNLSKAFSQCLAGLLTVAVQDLTITVTEKSSTIDKVSADDYPQKIVLGSGNSPPREVPGYVTVTFGNLYDRELRRITVDLRLPAVHLPKNWSQVGANVLDITYTYSFKSAPTTLNITRENKPELKNETSTQDRS